MKQTIALNKRSCFYALSLIFSEAYYNVINTPLMYIDSKNSANFLSFAFDDSAEKVWIAGTNISSQDMEKIVNKVEKTIKDSLDIPVHVNAILIEPTDTPKQTKSVSYSQSQNDINANTKDSYILIFKSFKEATEYLQENQNEPQDDISHLNEAETYYEKIVQYLNK